mmetsp:Transcript_49892/g.93513  ORF Transcript_49892/g.93513 Transcript_49892/m.93513 type:complete len:128 (-) Transcript_49892:20-403(-)
MGTLMWILILAGQWWAISHSEACDDGISYLQRVVMLHNESAVGGEIVAGKDRHATINNSVGFPGVLPAQHSATNLVSRPRTTGRKSTLILPRVALIHRENPLPWLLQIAPIFAALLVVGIFLQSTCM